MRLWSASSWYAFLVALFLLSFNLHDTLMRVGFAVKRPWNESAQCERGGINTATKVECLQARIAGLEALVAAADGTVCKL
jgi:hypothetical protein